MEEKIWFVFKFGDKHHQGPFSQKEINLFHQQGSLPKDTILWREGMKRWEPLDKCSEFNPSYISQKNTKNIKKSLSKFHQQKKEKSKKNFEYSLAEQTINKASKESYFIRSSIGVAIAFLVTFFIWPKNLFENNALVPRSLEPGERQYLKQIVKIQSNKKTLFRMAINRKRDQLWLASNYKGEGKVFLTLTSKPNKALSLKKVVITSQTPFRNGYARFTHFSLIKGNWPIPGEYQAKIYLYPKNRKKQVITWKGLFILLPKGKQSFSETLEHWKKNIRTHYLSPLKNQYQYYKTLKSHLIRMEEFYKKSFQTTTWQEFAALFEQNYNREIGPLLQRFVLDGHQLHLSLFNSDIENSKEYEKLFLYSKKVGELASDMLTQTEQGIIKKSEKHRISKKLLSRLNKLIEQADSAIKNIREKINYYQDELP